MSTRVDDEAAAGGEPRRRDEHDRDPRATEQLHEPGGDAPLGHGAHVSAEAPVGTGAEEIVDQAEEREAEHANSTSLRASVSPGSSPTPDRAQRRPARPR